MSKFNLLYRTIPQEIIPAKNYILTGVKNIIKADAQVDLIRNFDLEIDAKFLFPSYHNRDVSEFELQEKSIIKAGNDWRYGWNILESQLKEYAKQKNDFVLKKIL